MPISDSALKAKRGRDIIPYLDLWFEPIMRVL